MNNDIEQRSLKWFRERLGKITGSQVGNIFGKGRSKDDIFSKTAISYLISVSAERLIPDCIVNDDEAFSIYLDEINITSKAMRIGTEREAEARDLYSDINNINIEECGCINHPIVQGFASSPDGLIKINENIEGTIEIKCPKPSTYLEYLSAVDTPESLKSFNSLYYWQCIAHLAVTGAKWCDFIVYCPYIANPMHKVRIYRNAEALEQLYSRLELALTYIQQTVSKLSLKAS